MNYRRPPTPVSEATENGPRGSTPEVSPLMRLSYLTFASAHILLGVMSLLWATLIFNQTSLNEVVSVASLCLVFNSARKPSASDRFRHQLVIIFGFHNLFSFLLNFYEFIGGDNQISETIFLTKCVLHCFWLMCTILELRKPKRLQYL